MCCAAAVKAVTAPRGSAAAKASLQETKVAIQKAQVGFQATLYARNRRVQAYTYILYMQV